MWPSVTEDPVDELDRIERGEIVHPFAEADQLDGDAKLALYLHDDAALRGSVELGEDDASDVDDLGERTSLGEAVLAGGGVENEQHLGDRGDLLDDPLHLAELIHEARLGVQSASRVDEDHVRAAVTSRGDRRVRNRGGVGPFSAPYGLDADPLPPRRELVGGRGPERVGSAQNHREALGDEDARELAHGRGLAGAVDADQLTTWG